ncbi:GNAT family N-acetyltransferase [Actinotalea sp. AC32]|nr:GNAT family N-acetyltransferase [Actinotalea sp. AC32]
MIRSARLDDAGAVRAMSSALARRGPVPRDAFDAHLAAAVADPRSVLLVDDRGEDGLVGYALGVVAPMFVYDGLAFLQELYVVPERRGTGIGRALVAAFEDAARARGGGVVALATSRANAFYERLGFEGGVEYYRRAIGPAR